MLYLLARVADTIADSKVGETQMLLDHLSAYNDAVQGRSNTLPDFSELAALQSNEHEAELLRNVPDVVAGLQTYSRGRSGPYAGMFGHYCGRSSP